MLHAFKIGLKTPTIPWAGKFGKLNHKSISILAFDKNDNLIKPFESQTEAAKYFRCQLFAELFI